MNKFKRKKKILMNRIIILLFLVLNIEFIFFFRSCRLCKPQLNIASFSSSFNILIKFSTPVCPSQAKAHGTGRPIQTRSAPRAKALRTSEPVLTPPSNQTGILGIYFCLQVFSTISTISFKTSMVAGVVSS